MSSSIYAFKNYNVFIYIFKTSMSSVIYIYKTSMSSIFYIYKTSMSYVFYTLYDFNVFCLSEDSMSLSLCFLGLKQPLFQCFEKENFKCLLLYMVAISPVLCFIKLQCHLLGLFFSSKRE